MKIEEPKTPYSYQGDDSGDEGENRDLDSNLLVEKWVLKIFVSLKKNYFGVLF